MTEEWRPVPGWPRYEVSSEGRVRSVVRVRGAPPPKMLKPSLMKIGYTYVTLCGDHGRKPTYVHRIVCEAFHGPQPTPSHQVAHFDGCRVNNRADNLRWATPSSNREDSRRHGTMAVGASSPHAKLTDDDVRAIRQLAANGIEYRLLEEKFGVKQAQLSRIVNRTRWTHI